ncbi:hypothetical protein [Neisseria musculi]|uniref:hypothetical protein n=1 Tax=Neisseria musculi TaxID=1815583 RepID=UPI001FE48DA2|nr:hypothetical protein [Neisseria musculi]
MKKNAYNMGACTVAKAACIYYVDIAIPGEKRVRRSARTKDKKSAENLRDEFKHNAWCVSHLGHKPKRLWDEAALK